MQIHQYSVAKEEISREVAGVKRTCEASDREISVLMKANQ
jgi:hypothetical protein